jgi:site-specific recombinase XerD
LAPNIDAEAVLWDQEVRGFGIRARIGGAKTYILQYRAGTGRGAPLRKLTIGKHGSPWTPDMARTEAKRLLGLIAAGEDPAERRAVERKALTISELCDLYVAEGTTHKKPSTLKTDRGRIANHIKPLLGRKQVAKLTRADVERLLTDVKAGNTAAPKPKHGERQPGSITTGGPGVAAQCIALMSTLLGFAVARGLRPDNPALGIKKPPVRKMERFLSEAEIARLAIALDAEANRTGDPYPAAAIKLLLLTGGRRGEIIGLQWAHVDFERHCLQLRDSKTGAKVIYLNPPALELLASLPRTSTNPYVFVGKRTGGPLGGIDKVWFRVRAAAGLQQVRLHDLRHSFASMGVAGGLSLPIIGALLGHKHAATTGRYAHLSADPLRTANDMVGMRIAAAMKRASSLDNPAAKDIDRIPSQQSRRAHNPTAGPLRTMRT